MNPIDNNSLTDKELKKKLTTILWYNFQDGCTVEDVHDAVDEVMALISDTVAKAEIRGMEKAKSRVLRRTEIPKDAKNPTRDYVVILGEEIAGIIEQDIARLKPQQESETKK